MECCDFSHGIGFLGTFVLSLCFVLHVGMYDGWVADLFRAWWDGSSTNHLLQAIATLLFVVCTN